MAEKNMTEPTRLHGMILVSWSGLASDDTGEPYQPPQGYDLASVQFEGTVDGATTSIEGSNLEDQSAFQDITLSGDGDVNMKAPFAQALAFRPVVSGGTAPDMTAHALFRQRS